ncbi:MAG: zf-HC2 domain-containing protein [Planctomycetota bacterium]|nr:MAG: zf-HC2 domain-containing protein [Planctomycetota bacterium]
MKRNEETSPPSSCGACSHIQELVSGYMDGELTAPQTRLVERHLHSCQSCQEAYQELREFCHFLKDQWKIPAISEWEWQNCYRKTQRRIFQHLAYRQSFFSNLTLVALSVAAIFLLFLFLPPALLHTFQPSGRHFPAWWNADAGHWVASDRTPEEIPKEYKKPGKGYQIDIVKDEEEYGAIVITIRNEEKDRASKKEKAAEKESTKKTPIQKSK